MKKRILNNSSVKNISRFVSIKNDSIETVESDLEFDAALSTSALTKLISNVSYG
ncbi:hypothetical protein ACMVZU_000458 [Vibrio parahaemolyticus]|uniref:hypothetical protein n=1 Tax=Vibrio parahaemolyticus TaxID=670 RepID=UPI000419E1EE|nr:hypothetical protein [Vibrio parahaemolyticus]KIT53861.1 hypothetical protein H334_22860 [Vibrio parahaemolyticus 901128]MCS0088675.1 hypothetical protein [Vibrio parahaemolyticus]